MKKNSKDVVTYTEDEIRSDPLVLTGLKLIRDNGGNIFGIMV